MIRIKIKNETNLAPGNIQTGLQHSSHGNLTKIPPLLGERAGVRANVKTNLCQKLPITFEPVTSENAWDQPIKFLAATKAPHWIAVTSHRRFQHRRLFLPNNRPLL